MFISSLPTPVENLTGLAYKLQRFRVEIRFDGSLVFQYTIHLVSTAYFSLGLFIRYSDKQTDILLDINCVTGVYHYKIRLEPTERFKGAEPSLFNRIAPCLTCAITPNGLNPRSTDSRNIELNYTLKLAWVIHAAVFRKTLNRANFNKWGLMKFNFRRFQKYTEISVLSYTISLFFVVAWCLMMASN